MLMATMNGVGHAAAPKHAWWKESSVYQIYPASFKDSNGDGVGDIPGIISELDYVKKLGVDIVWLSPILTSPQVDMGYDVADYRNIHAPYGTMQDHDDLIAGLHSRGMKYVLDLVVNHTSDQHDWFKESRKSKDNEYRDWYIWKPAKYDKDGVKQPPNNWAAAFGGSAWTWDETTEEYYLHLFAVEQPDLNWENPLVVKAVHEVIRFWLDRGVDGFRMDVINFISKVPGLPDASIGNPNSKWHWGGEHFACGPRLHEFLHDIGSILKEYGAFSVGEMPCVTDPVEILNAVGFDRGELNMVFQFEIVDIDGGAFDKFHPVAWSMADLKSIVSKWQLFMLENDGWNAVFIENHDQPRSISRFLSDSPQWRALCGKLLATFFGLQSGTVFVYQGQELAQVNVPKEWTMDRYRDIECLNHWKEAQASHPDDKAYLQKCLYGYWLKARDNARTPMQWDSSENAGFTTATTPWMDIHEDYAEWNAASQKDDSKSPFAYWASVLKLRKSHPQIFVYGDFQLVDTPHANVFAYTRTAFDRKSSALVVTNFQGKQVEWQVPSEATKFLSSSGGAAGKVLIQNYEGEHGAAVSASSSSSSSTIIQLRPYEAIVFVLS